MGEMARLFSSGFELNSTAAGVEWTTTSGSPTISTSTVRSGTYAGQVQANQFFQTNLGVAVEGRDYFYRFYIRFATFPGATISISNGLVGHGLRINSSNQLYLDDENGILSGSTSSALSLDTWYRIEIRERSTGETTGQAEYQIDGVTILSTIATEPAGGSTFTFGNIQAGTFSFFLDDFAVNDSTGSFQNSWPGEGKIVHLRPSATGSNSAWTGDNTDIDEVTPDDTTTKISSNTTSQLEDVNIDNTPNDLVTPKVAQVGVRFNGAGASANASFAVRSIVGGVTTESSAITPSNTTFVTNAAASPRNYPITLYEPTKSQLDSAEIGVNLTASSTNAAQVSTLWMLVEYLNTSIDNEPDNYASYSSGVQIRG